MRSKNLIIRYISAILDIFVMLIAYVAANKIKFGWWRTGIRNEANSYMTLYMIFLAAYFVAILMFFAYENMLERSAGEELIAVTKLLVYMTAMVTAYIYITKTNDFYSRAQMGYFLSLSFILLYFERQGLKRYLTKSYHRSGSNEKIMLVTTSDQVEKVIKKIKETRNWYFRINSIAVLDKDMTGEVVNKVEVVATKQDLMDKIATSEVDGIFLHLPKSYAFNYPEFIDSMQEIGKQVHWNISEYGEASGPREIQFLGKFPTVTWSNKNYRIRHKAIKRAVDIVAGILGTVLLIPVYLLAVIGHAIERDLGHIIIGNVRVGRNGRRFYQYRFRTLRRDGKDISKTGMLLKRLGLTNLPTMWNVLWDDMSLVGVEAPSLPQFLNYSRSQRRGLSTKPGIIQFWPAYYWTRKNNEDITIERCEAEYVEHWSLWLDVKIVLRSLGLLIVNRSYSRYVHTFAEEDRAEEAKILGNFAQEEQPVAYVEPENVKRKPIYHFVKRVFDIIVSLICLVVLSPILLILAIVVRWEDGQSVFYKQLRVGKNGKKIYIYKIRTMKANVGDLEKILTPEQLEQYRKEFKIENDPRVTRVGNILRKTSLDELPQLLNILKGDLTFVGPRPIVEKETEIYGDDLGIFLSVRPGLTGYWQAYARNRATYESGQRQKMELYYAQNQSLWLDIKIMCKTVGAVIKRDGAM